MNFWDIVNKTANIIESEEKRPQFKRYGMMVYREDINDRHEIGIVQKGVLDWLTVTFPNKERDEVLKLVKDNPNLYYDDWVSYAKKHGIDKEDGYEFGWDWITSGEALTIPGRNL